jgi:hypothetical protein
MDFFLVFYVAIYTATSQKVLTCETLFPSAVICNILTKKFYSCFRLFYYPTRQKIYTIFVKKKPADIILCTYDLM